MPKKPKSEDVKKPSDYNRVAGRRRNSMVVGEPHPDAPLAGGTDFAPSQLAAGIEDPTNMPNLPWGERELPEKKSSGGEIRHYDEGTDSVQPAPPTPQAPTTQAAPSGMMFDDMPDESAQLVPSTTTAIPASFDDMEDDSEKYTAPLQQVGAAIEGGIRGFAGPVGTAAELGLSKLGVPGLSAQEQNLREQYNPELEGIAKGGGFVGSMMTGIGELSAVAKGAELAAKVANLGKFGSTVLKGALEGGMLQGGDEISKAMLGQGDPEAPVAAALSHIAGASLLGGGINGVVGTVGAGIRALGSTKVGQSAANMLADFGRKWDWIQGNAEPLVGATAEINNRLDETNKLMFGGLKRPLIDKLTLNVDPEDLATHVGDVSSALLNAPSTLKNEPTFQQAVKEWEAKVTPKVDPMTLAPLKTPSPSDVFQATDFLKRQMGEWGQYNKDFTPAADIAWRNASRGVTDTLKGSLENTDVWGPMGKAQASINSKLSPMFDIQKEFQGKFTSNEMGDRVADPAKINTFLMQNSRAKAGLKTSAGLKSNYISNYLDQSQDLADAYNKIHLDNGIEAPYPSGLKPTPVLNDSLDPSPTAGSKLADWFASRGYPTLSGNIASKLAHKTVGAGIGYVAGGVPGVLPGVIGTDMLTEHLSPILKNVVGDKLNKYAVPAALKVLSEGGTSGMPEIMQHAENVAKGASRMKKAVDAVFNTPSLIPQQALNAAVSSRQRDKLKKMIADGELNKQIQSEARQSSAAPAQPPSALPAALPRPAGYAEGGVVTAPVAPLDVESPISSSPSASAVSTHYPAQAMMLSTAKGRVSNYLNSLRPKPDELKLPFDSEPNTKIKERNYNKALDIANDPLSVLQKVQEGTVTPDHIKHLVSMYPEIHSQLSKQLTKKISENQLKEKKPHYNVVKGLSMFLGTALDSTLTPAGIQAAQPKPPQNQPQTPTTPASNPKHSMNALNKLPDQYKTAGQSAEGDRGSRE